MRNNQILEKIKAFGMTNQMLIEDLGRIASLHAVNWVSVLPRARRSPTCITHSLNRPYGKRQQ